MEVARPQSCERARQWASQSLDRELSELERAVLDRHVAACASCAAFVGRVTAVAAALRSAPLVRPLQPVVVPSAPRRERERGRRHLAASRAVLAALAAAAVLVTAASLVAFVPGPRLVLSGVAQLEPDNGRAELDRVRLTAAFARIPAAPPWVGHGAVT